MQYKYWKKNIDKINWIYLSMNPNAINILEKYPDKVDWSILSENPRAINLLEKNLDTREITANETYKSI